MNENQVVEIRNVIESLLTLNELIQDDPSNIIHITQDRLIDMINQILENKTYINIENILRELLIAIDKENKNNNVPYDLYAADLYEYLDLVLEEEMFAYTE